MRIVYRGKVHLVTVPAPRLVRIVCNAAVLDVFGVEVVAADEKLTCKDCRAAERRVKKKEGEETA